LKTSFKQRRRSGHWTAGQVRTVLQSMQGEQPQRYNAMPVYTVTAKVARKLTSVGVSNARWFVQVCDHVTSSCAQSADAGVVAAVGFTNSIHLHQPSRWHCSLCSSCVTHLTVHTLTCIPLSISWLC